MDVLLHFSSIIIAVNVRFASKTKFSPNNKRYLISKIYDLFDPLRLKFVKLLTEYENVFV